MALIRLALGSLNLHLFSNEIGNIGHFNITLKWHLHLIHIFEGDKKCYFKLKESSE